MSRGAMPTRVAGGHVNQDRRSTPIHMLTTYRARTRRPSTCVDCTVAAGGWGSSEAEPPANHPSGVHFAGVWGLRLTPSASATRPRVFDSLPDWCFPWPSASRVDMPPAWAPFVRRAACYWLSIFHSPRVSPVGVAQSRPIGLHADQVGRWGAIASFFNHLPMGIADFGKRIAASLDQNLSRAA